MKTLRSTLLATAILATGFVTAQAQTADEIINKYNTAIGADNWKKVTSMKTVGTLSTNGMELGVTQTTVNGKAARTDITAMGMAGYSIVTPTEGWSFMPFMGQSEVEKMKDDQLKASQATLDVKNGQSVDLKADAAKLEFVGKEKFNDVECLKVKLTTKDNDEQQLYFDAKTYYLIGSKGKVKMQGQEMEMTRTLSDYQKQENGIVMAMKQDMGMQGSMTIKSVEFNKAIDDSVFKPSK